MVNSPAKLFSIAFLVLMLMVSTGMVAEARQCETKSHSFKGHCVSHNNCENVCKGEKGQGFTGGYCHGVRHRCYCTKQC